MSIQKSLLGSHLPQMLAKNGQRLLTMPADWNGLQIIKSYVPDTAEFGPQYSGMPMLTFGLSGQGTCYIRSGRRTKVLRNRPPYFNVHSATYERESGYRKGIAGSALCLSLPPTFVQRYLPEHSEYFDLKTEYGCSDNHLRNLVLSLAEEFQSGLDNGPIYAEGLSLAILGWLNCHYSIKTNSSVTGKKFPPKIQAKIIEFVDSFFSSNLTIEMMAKELDFSPSHFCALFSSTFGTSPHRYVMKKRIEKGAHLLRSEPRMSVADIALATGFSSQAHFTKAFKSIMKRTPSRWKAG